MPATLTIDLGKQISDRSKTGMEVRLYSAYPFKSRTGGGPRDAFEKKALAALNKDPDTPYYSFEDYQRRPALRYATARKMKESCVHCHNTHPQRPDNKTWSVGEVRGVVEIIRPLDNDIGRSTSANLRETFFLVVVVAGSLVGLTGLAVLAGNLRRRWVLNRNA